MSKTKAPAGLSWAKTTAELKAKVKFVLQQAQNNRYSVSRIYAAHNAVFELQEAPQTCSTCLTTRVKNLRKWWTDNAKEDTTGDATPVLNTLGVATTGEKHEQPHDVEATDYEGVVAKYKLAVGAGLGNAESGSVGEVATLETLLGEDSPLGANEKELVRQRIGAIQVEQHDAALNDSVNAKLTELGVTEETSDEDRLEAYQLLAGTEGNTDNENAHYNAKVEELKRGIAAKSKTETDAPAEGARRFDMGDGVLGMDFTPSADDANKGTILNADGSKVAAGTYTAADGTVIAVAVGSKARIKTAE